MPWYSLEPRGIPLLDEKEISPAALLGAHGGRCAEGYRSARDVTLLRHIEGLAHRPVPPGEARAFSPLHVPATGRNRFRSYLIDFGRIVVGNLSLHVEGARGGEIVDTLHVEIINEARLEAHLLVPTHCRTAFGNRLICREGQTRHAFFHPYGFRYLVLTVRDSGRPLRITPKLHWIGYPLERKGSFRSSDPALNAIWEACAWTQQCCSLDAYVDTPWREQAQWWGDARVQSQNTFFLSGDARLLRRGIASIGGQTTPDGLTYGHAPTMAHGCILPDFTLIWIITIWDYYWQTGSLDPFREQAAALARAFDYFTAKSHPQTGLAGYDPRYWLFLDWTGLPKDGYGSVLNLWLLIALEKTAQMHRLTGRPRQARPLEEWARKLRRSLSALINRDGLLCDGRDWKGKIIPSASIHAQTLAIISGLSPRHEQTMLDRVLVPFIRGETAPAVTPSPYWITYVFQVLAARGYGREVLAFIKDRWAEMAKYGATWEVFDMTRGDGNNSHSHAWSAHPLYHLMQIAGGINQTAAGWKEIRFAPVFHGDFGETAVPTPLGTIRSRWKRSGTGIKVKLTVPKGIRAR